MRAPQIIMIVLLFAPVIAHTAAAQFGKFKWSSFLGACIAKSVMAGILWWGGFWS